MKKIFRFIISSILKCKAKSYLKKNNVDVIAITGSIGKTSTKEAVYFLLKNKFSTYKSPKGFNTDIGLSLSILQEDESGFSSFISWFKILKRIFTKKLDIYKKMVLEMGADKRGDIKKLISIAKPSISIITNVNPVHLGDGQFKDIEDIAKEKSSLIKGLNQDNLAILNFDDENVRNMQTIAKKFSYGSSADVDLKVSNIKTTNTSISFLLDYKNEFVSFNIPVLGAFQVYVFLPAIATALNLGFSLKECANILKSFKLPKSRMNPIKGINDSLIIDSSYNSSPISANKALELLSSLSAKRKISALGSMNELGEISKEMHINLGIQAAQISNIIVAVGLEAANIKQGAISVGMPEQNIYTFFNSEDAGIFLKDFIKADDIILVKGSQNKVRMERLIKLIMDNPSKAKNLLCRQDDSWDKVE